MSGNVKGRVEEYIDSCEYVHLLIKGVGELFFETHAEYNDLHKKNLFEIHSSFLSKIENGEARLVLAACFDGYEAVFSNSNPEMPPGLDIVQIRLEKEKRRGVIRLG